MGMPNNKKWRCTKCGRQTATNGPRPFSLGCPKAGVHDWKEERWTGVFWDRMYDTYK